MTAGELKAKLRYMEKQADIVSFFPNSEMKNKLVKLKNISLCKCEISEKSYIDPLTNTIYRQKVYKRNEDAGILCTKLIFYGPELIRSTVENLIESLSEIESAVVVSNSAMPHLFFDLVDLDRITETRLKSEWQFSINAFDSSTDKSLVYSPDRAGAEKCVILYF